LTLGEGELFPGLEDEWAYEARDAHRGWTAALLEELAVRAERDGDTRGAIELSRRAAALDPLSEEAHRSLMRRLADAGDRPGALTVYSELRTRLLKTLRIGPSDETRELAESLRAPPGGELVPTQLKRVDRALFVGREAELARLRRLRTAVSETTRVGLIAGELGAARRGSPRALPSRLRRKEPRFSTAPAASRR
jgi:DNA-binding SARP family transcriptional activator